MLSNLLGKLDCPAVVFDDGSSPKLRVPPGTEIVRQEQNRGKTGYWLTVSRALRHIKKMEQPQAWMFLADDLDPLTATPAADAWAHWLTIQDPNKAALNILPFPWRDSCWNGIKRKPYSDALWRAGFVDGAFLCPPSTLEVLNWKIFRISRHRWRVAPLLGSGVWEQLTERLRTKGGQFFELRESIFSHDDHPSLMNPQAQKFRPCRSIQD